MGKLRPKTTKGWPEGHGQPVMLHLKTDPSSSSQGGPAPRPATLSLVAVPLISSHPWDPHCLLLQSPGGAPAETCSQ